MRSIASSNNQFTGKLLCLFAMAAFLMPAKPLIGEDLTGLSLEDLMNVEVTSASKRTEKLVDAPAAVFVVTHDEIEQHGYRTLAEALRQVVGFYVSDDRNYSYIGVRGYARPGDYNTRILLLIDGVRVNDPLYDMAPIGNDAPIDMESLDRIEVVKGPGSALWGANAVLAVLNLITKQGADIGGVGLQQEYGSEAHWKSRVEFGEEWENGLQMAGSVSTIRSDGQRSIYFPAYDDPATNHGLANNLDGETASRGFLNASYGDLRLRYFGGRRTKTIPTGSYETVFNAPGSFTYDNRQSLDLSYEGHPKGRSETTLSAHVYHSSYVYDGQYMLDYGYENLVANRDHDESKTWGGEIRFAARLGKRAFLTSGMEYADSYRMLLDNYDANPDYAGYANVIGSRSVRSFYTQAETELHPKVRLITGARVDDYSTYGRRWSPRAALVYRPDPSSTIKLLRGRAFRAPNFYETSYYDSYSAVANPNLNPETITTSELVWERNLGSTRLITSLFRFDLDDIITQVALPDETQQFQNHGSVRSQGVEMQAERHTSGGFDGYLGFTLLKATNVQTHEEISNSPRFLANAGCSVPLHSLDVTLSPSIQWIGSRLTLSGGSIAPSATVNLEIRRQGRPGALSLSLGIYNVFNSETFSPGGNEHLQDVIPQVGRTIQLQSEYRF